MTSGPVDNLYWQKFPYVWSQVCLLDKRKPLLLLQNMGWYSNHSRCHLYTYLYRRYLYSIVTGAEFDCFLEHWCISKCTCLVCLFACCLFCFYFIFIYILFVCVCVFFYLLWFVCIVFFLSFCLKSQRKIYLHHVLLKKQQHNKQQ